MDRNRFYSAPSLYGSPTMTERPMQNITGNGTVSIFQASTGSATFAILHPDGTATIDWPSVRRMAAALLARGKVNPRASCDIDEVVAGLLWAVAHPGVKP